MKHFMKSASLTIQPVRVAALFNLACSDICEDLFLFSFLLLAQQGYFLEGVVKDIFEMHYDNSMLDP